MIAIRIAALVAVVASACTELGDVPRDVCGNGVIEAGNAEDCDGSAGCGPPDSTLACRLLCDPDAAAPACPGQAVCGRDGSCHAPGGSFEVATSFTWTTPHLLIADTSADGYPELIGVANQHVEVRLGGPDLGFSPLPPIPSPGLSGIPRVADLEGDGDADVALPVGAGVFALSGHPSTVLDPFFYNSFDAPGEGRIVGGIVKFAEVILVPLIGARDPVSGQSVLTFPGDRGASFALFPPGRGVDDVAGDILAVGTVADGSLTLRTVALPFTTGRTIALYDVALGLDTATVTARPAPVSLPVGTSVRHGVWFADFDGDGHVDLVASVTQDGTEGIAVAWGRGDGVLQDASNVINQASVVWRADRDQDGDGFLDGALAPAQIGQVTDNALILGDEGDADVVGAGGLYTTSCLFHTQCNLYLLRASTRVWSGAVITDVNGDALADVVAFSEDQTGLDVLLNTTTTLLFNDATVATGGVVERLIPGDFNGDSINDLAYVDAVAGVPFTDTLSVSFGRFLAPPAPPVFMGSIGELVTGGELLSPGAGGAFDYVYDLVLVTDREVDGAVRRGAAIVFGSTAGRLFAPLLPEEIELPMRAVTSTRIDEAFPFDGNGDGFADLAVLTTTTYGPSSLGDTGPLTVRHARFYAGQSDGQVDEQGAVALDLQDLKLTRARWLGADVTATATDEAIGLLDDGSLLIVRLDGGCTGLACLVRVAAPAPAVADPVSFIAVDADGDGDTDLVGVLRNRDGRVTRDATVLVWWNQDGFSADRTQRFDGDIADAAVLDRERDGTPELVILFRDLAGGSGEGRGLQVATHTAGGFSELVPLAPALDGVAVRAADVDGDGLDDLVVLAGIEREAPRELSVYLQAEARIPAGEE